jgi:RNA polymerase sigma-70 factor (ECF subfamily)
VFLWSAFLTLGEPTLAVAADQVRDDVDVAALFDQHAEALARFVARILGGGAHVDDVVQEVFLTAHQKRAQLRSIENVRAWLYGVATHKAQHHIRAKVRFRDALERLGLWHARSAPSPEGDVVTTESRARVQRAIATLSPHLRTVFVLYELEECSGREIALALSLPEKTVWSRLRVARERFSQAVQAAATEERT